MKIRLSRGLRSRRHNPDRQYFSKSKYLSSETVCSHLVLLLNEFPWDKAAVSNIETDLSSAGQVLQAIQIDRQLNFHKVHLLGLCWAKTYFEQRFIKVPALWMRTNRITLLLGSFPNRCKAFFLSNELKRNLFFSHMPFYFSFFGIFSLMRSKERFNCNLACFKN